MRQRPQPVLCEDAHPQARVLPAPARQRAAGVRGGAGHGAGVLPQDEEDADAPRVRGLHVRDAGDGEGAGRRAGEMTAPAPTTPPAPPASPRPLPPHKVPTLH